jgi:hypothetical protein
MMIDVAQARRDLTDDDVGFFVVRQLYTPAEIDAYRETCERFMRSSKRIQQRIITDSIEDYVHPRSHDQHERTVRIYQHFHNHRDDMVGRLLDRAITIRNQIEEVWLSDDVYRSEKETLLDYVIVTHYYGNKGLLTKHADYDGPAPRPLVQFWVALSTPGKDYQGGNLVLYSKSGRARRVETDLSIHKGDAVIFDKSLPHEVELTEVSGAGALGRWSVLIGARAPRDSRMSAAKKRWLYGPPLYPLLAWGSRTLKRLRAEPDSSRR